jgi:hypothetical protein
MSDDRDHFQYQKKSDTHLAGETESREWLKSTPTVYGINRALQGMGKTTAKRPRNGNKPPTTPEAA